jgi:hypothetical protein
MRAEGEAEVGGAAGSGHLTDEQWALADEVAADLRTYVEMVSRLEKDRAFADAFTDWLAIWSVLLGALAWEQYTALIVLLRAKKVRAAFALGRALYDYFVRLAYYRAQAQPTIATWRADARKMKSLKNGLQRIDAWRDWFTINKKMADHLKRTQPDLSDMSPQELAEFQGAMKASEGGEPGVRRFDHMLTRVFPGDERTQQFLYAQWTQRSAYLHGDPLTRVDVMRERVTGTNADYDVLLDETRITENHVLSIATFFALGIMEQMYLITDRQYALTVLVPKVRRLFPFTDPTAVKVPTPRSPA